jgi:predicted permease
MRTWPLDLRHAVRLLSLNSGLTLTALVTLALGIGATTALFSIVHGVLLRPIPLAEPHRLVRVSEFHQGANAAVRGALLTAFTLQNWTASRTLEALATYNSNDYTWTTDTSATRVEGASVDPVLFALLRVKPAVGRFFTDADTLPGANPVLVLSDRFWRERFGGNPGALGQIVRLSDTPYEIVGVAPPGFAFPGPGALFWTPRTRPKPGEISITLAIGRLQPGATIAQAEAEGTAAARREGRSVIHELLLGKGGPPHVRVRTILDEATAHVRPALLVLTAGVLLVLVIGCANVTNLLLSRGVGRRRELAVRAALGASRGRLTRLLLMESLLLAVAGGAAGVFLAWLVIGALPSLAPSDFPRLDNVAVNVTVLGAGLLASLAAGLLSGLLPALRAGRADLSIGLRDDDARSAGMASPRLRFMLLVGEAAAAVVLIVGAAVLVEGFVRLSRVDPGYNPANVLTARVYLTGATAAPGRRVAFVESLLARVRTALGVAAAGAGNMAPFGESVFVSGTQSRPDQLEIRAVSHVVTPGYAEALGLRLRSGRFIAPDDAGSATEAIMVNETFARTAFRDDKPVVGREFHGFGSKSPGRIVGIVGDVLKEGPESAPQPEVYGTHAEGRAITREINLIVRTSGDPLAFAPILQQLVRAEDPQAAVDEIAALADRLSLSMAAPRFFATVLVAFAALAVTLAAVGLYGVLSYLVSQRRRELGIRAALGAGRRDLMALVLRTGLGATILGLGAGLVMSWIAASLMRRLMPGLGAIDPLPFATAAVLLLAVAATACLVPARRAASSDPLEALRHE